MEMNKISKFMLYEEPNPAYMLPDASLEFHYIDYGGRDDRVIGSTNSSTNSSMINH